MQRLTRILLLSMLMLLLGSQAAFAGGLKDLFGMSKSQEKEIAEDMLSEFKKDPGLVTKGKQYDMVQTIGNKIVKANDMDEYDYKFFVIKQDEVNAFATPAGYIYMTTGLLDVMGYDKSMVAGVMAHELGHAKDRHVAKGYEKAMKGSIGLGILGIVLGDGSDDIVDAAGMAGGAVLLKYNRDQEEWADRHGVDLAYNAGYDAYGMVRGLQCLDVMYGSADDITVWMQQHPATDDRIERTARIAHETSGKEHGYMAIPRPPKDHVMYAMYGDGKAPDVASGGDIGSAETYSRDPNEVTKSTPKVKN